MSIFSDHIMKMEVKLTVEITAPDTSLPNGLQTGDTRILHLDPQKSFLNNLQKLDYIVVNEISVLIFDHTHLEWDATPLGVGMEDKDEIYFLDNIFFYKEQKITSTLLSKHLRIPRRNEIIRFGLNLTIDEGLPVIHGSSSHQENRFINLNVLSG